MRHFVTTTRLLAVLSAVALVLVACGNGDDAPDDAAPEPATDETPDDAPDEDLEPIRIANVYEISGAGSSFGTKWGQGVQLAVEEINEAGGILGREIELEEFDTQSEPPLSVTAVRRALEQVEPFALFGSVFSSSTIVNMEVAQEAGVPQFTGSESPAITQQGNPYIFMSSYDSGTAFLKFGAFLDEIGAENVAVVFQNDEFGQGASRAIIPEIEARGLNLVEEITTEVGQVDFAGEAARIINSGADAVIAVFSDEEAGRAHVGFGEAGVYDEIQMIGINPVVQSTALDLAGDAADGVQGIVDFSPAAPELQPITDIYVERWGPGRPDHNFFKGYFSVYMMKIVLEQIGELDQEAFINAIHDNTFCASDHPELRGNSVHYAENGRVDRDSFVVEVVDGQHNVLDVVGPLNPENFEHCG